MGRKYCKICSLIERYDLASPNSDIGNIDDYLLARWTGSEGYEETGYDPLAEWFNKYLIKHLLERSGEPAPEHRIEGIYRTLKEGDDIAKQEVIQELQATGIDPVSIEVANNSYGTIEEQLIVKSTMRRHLNECLDGEKPSVTSSEKSEWERNQFEYVKQLHLEKIDDALKSLENKDEFVGLSSSEKSVKVILSCSEAECTYEASLQTILDRGYFCPDHGMPNKTLMNQDAP